jgi:hypothetical protein
VQAAVDPDDRLAFLGEGARLFSGAVMIAISCSRPSAVLPMLCTCMRSDSLSSSRTYSTNLV